MHSPLLAQHILIPSIGALLSNISSFLIVFSAVTIFLMLTFEAEHIPPVDYLGVDGAFREGKFLLRLTKIKSFCSTINRKFSNFSSFYNIIRI